MTRHDFIERTLRQIYGGFPDQDAEIDYDLANKWLIDGTAIAAKQCYKEAIQVDGIFYVNNGFYTTFKGLVVTKDENFLYKVSLPSMPVGIGSTQGISTLQFKDSNGNLSLPVIWISENQKGYSQNMRPIPNKILAFQGGDAVYAINIFSLIPYTASVTMISAGDDSNLDSVLNVPPDYHPVITEYMKGQLSFERAQPQDLVNDGVDSSVKQ
jgi:hypothetical protein